MRVTFLNQSLLQRLEAVGRLKSSGCSSHVCTSSDHVWFRKDASVLALSQRVEKNESVHLGTAKLLLATWCAYSRARLKKKKTVDGSHGDDPTGASSPSSV